MKALHAVAVTYGQRPSAIIGIPDARLAYDFDLAVLGAISSKEQPAKDDPNAWGDWKALATNRNR